MFWASVCKKWGIFECFLTVFCSNKDRIVLFYDIIKVSKTRVISRNKDGSVSISCFWFVEKCVTARDLESFVYL